MLANFADHALSQILQQWGVSEIVAPPQLDNINLVDLLTYQVRSRREIIALLRRVCQAGEHVRLITLTYPDGIASVMLDVDEELDHLVLSLVAPSMSGKFGQQQILFEMTLTGIRIFFYAELKPYTYRGRAAFCCTIPGNIIRIQRRDSYRVPTKALGIVVCDIADGAEIFHAELHNISSGGIGVADKLGSLPTTIGRIHKNCVIHLPEKPIELSLELRSVRKDETVEDKPVLYLGYQFYQPGERLLTVIQNYVIKLEQRKNAERIKT